MSLNFIGFFFVFMQGPEVRGSKPILVCFEKYADKDEVMRKAKFLRGTNIYVGEDFSKRVKDQRHELQKFMKGMKRRRPNSTFKMQYDKVGNISLPKAFNRYMFNVFIV